MGRVVVVAAALAAVTARAQQRAPEFGQQDAQAIRQGTQEYAQAFNARDTQKLLTFYSGETVFMPPNSPTLRGRDSLGDFYKNMYDEGAEQLVMEPKDVGGQGTLAYESGTFSLRRRPPSGEETRDRGKYMFIWRFYRAQNAWLIHYTIWSSDLPQRVATGGGN